MSIWCALCNGIPSKAGRPASLLRRAPVHSTDCRYEELSIHEEGCGSRLSPHWLVMFTAAAVRGCPDDGDRVKLPWRWRLRQRNPCRAARHVGVAPVVRSRCQGTEGLLLVDGAGVRSGGGRRGGGTAGGLPAAEPESECLPEVRRRRRCSWATLLLHPQSYL